MRALLLVAVLGLLAFPLPAHADPTPTVVVDQDVDILVGVPDEIVFSPPTIDEIDVAFTLASSVTSIEATLSWPSGLDDLDLELTGPGGATTGTMAQSGNNPEVATYASAPAGDWVAHIYPFVSLPTTAHLHIVVYGGGGAPPLTTLLWGIPTVGAEDTTYFFPHESGGVPPYSYAWDADGDGSFETASHDLNTTYSPGDHPIALRVTDSLGSTATATQTVHVYTADHNLAARCGGDAVFPYWALEFNATHDTCWIHDGHHTYFFDKVYAFREAHGFAFSVEQQFAPGTDSDLRLEISMDGLAWTEVGRGHYTMVGVNEGVPERQNVFFDITNGSGESFRYMRVHEPPSVTQGLSGYLDHSDIGIVADDVSDAPTPTLAHQTLAFPCETKLMERFFDTHPCTFGGVDRWDSASFYHTYIAGDGATLDNVSGNFTLAPFRTDDFFEGHEDAPQSTFAYLITSVDGRTWTTQAQINATYGVEQSFSVDLGGQAARFVRLFPEYHASFDDEVNNAPLHHPRGYFLHSTLTLEGMLPTA